MNENQTIKVQALREGKRVLLGFSPYGHTEDEELTGRHPFGRKTGMEGSDEIGVLSPAISRKHGEFGLVGGYGFYRDLESRNGTYINGERCNGIQALQDGDILSFPFGHTGAERTAYMMIYTVTQSEYTWEKLDLTGSMDEIMISRSRDQLGLGDQTISRNHAIFLKSEAGWSITDLNSTNGVLVNQRKIEGRTFLRDFDVVRIGYTWFVYLQNQLWVGREPVKPQPVEPVQAPAEET